MMIPIKKALDAVAEFASKDVVPVMADSPRKFLAQMAIGAARVNPMPIIRPYEPFLKMTGIISEDGSMVDKKALEASLMSAFKEMPKVSMLGLTFTQQDALALLERMVDDDE